MSSEEDQEQLFPEDVTAAPMWDRQAAERAIDELFQFARQYNSSRAFHDLMQFVVRFRFYSPFNAMLAHIQMPGARFVAPAHKWERNYRRCITPGARPIVLLQPMGPVMFVFDVSDTEPLPDAPPLPRRSITHSQLVLARSVKNSKGRSRMQSATGSALCNVTPAPKVQARSGLPILPLL